MRLKYWLAAATLSTALGACSPSAEQRSLVEAERSALREQQAVLERATNELIAERKQMVALRRSLESTREQLEASKTALETAQSELTTERDQIKEMRDLLMAARKDLDARKTAFETARRELDAERAQAEASTTDLGAEKSDAKAALTAAEAGSAGSQQAEPDDVAVLRTYADIAHAMYEDSLIAAKGLKAAIDDLVARPSDASLAAAKDAWRAARVPYSQTEVYRFGNPIVDEWEVRVNGWPLDEGMIDYVDAAYGSESDDNDFYTANLIANPTLEVGGNIIDARLIDARLIESLHEADQVEANVTTGYHVVEFLLWGQDLNHTGPGAGARPYTDFDPANCTGGHCERRIAYLQTATDLIITDLEEMVANWAKGGAARRAVTGDNVEEGLLAMFTGLGSLSYGELAGERMMLGLLLSDPEEEHDCFSDNTHNSHYNNIVGIKTVIQGRYVRLDGSRIEGASLLGLLPEDVASGLLEDLEATLAVAGIMKASADRGEMSYDQMLAADNPEGNVILESVIKALSEQTKSIDLAANALGLENVEFERSDSADGPGAVFN